MKSYVWSVSVSFFISFFSFPLQGNSYPISCGYHSNPFFKNICRYVSINNMYCWFACFQTSHWASWWLSGKESACWYRRCGFDTWVRKIPWRRKWQPTLVFLPGKFHGQRSLAGYSPWGQKRTVHDWATKRQTNFMLLVRLLLKTMFYSLVSFDELWGEADCFKEWVAGELIVNIYL